MPLKIVLPSGVHLSLLRPAFGMVGVKVNYIILLSIS